MRRESAEVIVRRSPAAVFDWVADYRNVPRVLDGVQRWTPKSTGPPKVGSAYDVQVGVLGIGLGATLELVEWRPPHKIAFSASTAIGMRGDWDFSPRSHGRATRVVLTISYEPPGAFLGGFIAARAEGLMRNRILAALERMREAIEAEVAA